MAEDEEASEGKKGKGDKGKKKKSNLVPAVVVAFGMLIGGKMMGGGKAAPATAAGMLAAGHGTEAETMNCATQDILHPPVKGGVYTLDSTTINLANGSYVKVGITLELSSAVVLETFKAEKEADPAKGVLIATITGRDKAEFASPQALEALREKLLAEIRPKFECKVLDISWSDWVVQ